MRGKIRSEMTLVEVEAGTAKALKRKRVSQLERQEIKKRKCRGGEVDVKEENEDEDEDVDPDYKPSDDDADGGDMHFRTSKRTMDRRSRSYMMMYACFNT